MRPRLNFSPAQARAGRALCAISIEELAQRAGLEAEAVDLYELGEGGLSDSERAALGLALYANGRGVIALAAESAGEGVRFARPRNVGLGGQQADDIW